MWNGRVYNAPPDEEFQRLMRQLRNARTKTVLHRETCPCCGAKLVNLYRKDINDSAWKCRKCWEAYENVAKAAGNNTPYCATCQTYKDAVMSEQPVGCAWYVENAIMNNKSTKSCPNYKPVKGE